MIVHGYCRVSTTEQRWGTTAQQAAITDWALAHPDFWPGYQSGHSSMLWWTDTLSSANKNRQSFQAMMKRLESYATAPLATNNFVRPKQLVVVVRLDRLARSTRELLNLCEEFDRLGVTLVSLDGALDTATPVGRLQRTVLAAIAEFERDLIRERTVAGLAAAKAAGVRLGAPPQFSYADIAQAYKQGLGVRAIARKLNAHPSTISRRLMQER